MISRTTLYKYYYFVGILVVVTTKAASTDTASTEERFRSLRTKEGADETKDEDVAFWKRFLAFEDGSLVTPTASPTTSAPIVPPTDSPVAIPPPPTITLAPVVDPPAETTAPTSTGTPAPTFQLCSGNIPVTVSVGPNSNPQGRFQNVPLEQSLENVIDCLALDEGEQHNQQSHVWWFPGPLELLFDFDGTEYDLTAIYFWNYFGEGFDVDQINFQFFDNNDSLIGNQTVFPRLGENAQGNNNNDVVAEKIPLNQVFRASSVSALVVGTNGQIDFQNFVFAGSVA